MQVSLTIAFLLMTGAPPDTLAEREIVLDEAVQIIAYADEGAAAREDDEDAFEPELPIVDAEDEDAAKKPPGPSPKGCRAGDGPGDAWGLALLAALLLGARRRGR